MAKQLNGHAEGREPAGDGSDSPLEKLPSASLRTGGADSPDGRVDADSRNATEGAACKSEPETAAPVAEAPAKPEDDTMHPRSVFRPGNAPPRTVVEWVAANLKVHPVKPGEAPDAAAWGLLQWARSSAASASAFYQMWAKLLPSRAQVDEQDTSDDDGGELVDTLGFVYNAKRTAVLRAGAEGVLCEPPLSWEDPPRDDGEPA